MNKTNNIPNTGFTLIELMIAIALVVIFVSLAVPSFTNLILRNTVQSDSNDFIVALNLTRSEAIKRNRTVDIKAQTGGWFNGYIIETFNDDGTVETIQNYTPSDNAAPAVETSSPILTTVSFLGTGLLASDAPSFRVCNSSGQAGTQIDVINTGRVTTSQISCP